MSTHTCTQFCVCGSMDSWRCMLASWSLSVVCVYIYTWVVTMFVFLNHACPKPCRHTHGYAHSTNPHQHIGCASLGRSPEFAKYPQRPPTENLEVGRRPGERFSVGGLWGYLGKFGAQPSSPQGGAKKSKNFRFWCLP